MSKRITSVSLLRISFFVFATMVFASSCKTIMNEAFLNNRCERWEVIDKSTGQSVWVKEGCGGEITNMKQKATQATLDQYEAQFGQRYEIRSVTWDKDSTGVKGPRQ